MAEDNEWARGETGLGVRPGVGNAGGACGDRKGTGRVLPESIQNEAQRRYTHAAAVCKGESN